MDVISDIPHQDPLLLRRATARDEPFLEGLFRSAREHLQHLPLPPAQREALIKQQYLLQRATYAQHWPNAQNLVVERAGTAIGHLLLDDAETRMHIVDFVLAPAMRRKGYGTAILRAVQASAGHRRVTLSVDRHNGAARQLYRRLGFRVEAVSETHESMSWTPVHARGVGCMNGSTAARSQETQ